MESEILQEIKKTNKLLSLMATKDLAQNEKVVTLSKAGFAQKEIAEFLGISGNTVNKTLNRYKKKK